MLKLRHLNRDRARVHRCQRFVVEASTDAQTWSIVIDRRQSENTRAERNDVFPPGLVARYVRLSFADDDPRLGEVEIQGILSVR